MSMWWLIKMEKLRKSESALQIHKIFCCDESRVFLENKKFNKQSFDNFLKCYKQLHETTKQI